MHHTYLTLHWFTLKSIGKLGKAKTLENKEQNTIRPRKLVDDDLGSCQKCDKIRQKQNTGNIIILLLIMMESSINSSRNISLFMVPRV